MSKSIRMIVVMEYEPQPDWYTAYSDSTVNIEEMAAFDAQKIMSGELIAPQDWDEGAVTVVSAFIINSENSLETMVSTLARGINDG